MKTKHNALYIKDGQEGYNQDYRNTIKNIHELNEGYKLNIR